MRILHAHVEAFRRREVGGVRLEGVVERARGVSVAAEVHGIRPPPVVGECDPVPPHERGVGAETVDEQGAPRGGGVTLRSLDATGPSGIFSIAWRTMRTD